MEKINSSNFLIAALNSAKSINKKCITNYYFSTSKSVNLIDDGNLFHEKIENVVFVLKQNTDFFNLYFFSPDEYELKLSLLKLIKQHSEMSLVVDIVTKDFNSQIIKLFEEAGFNLYTSLMRMSRISKGLFQDVEHYDQHLKIADISESLKVYEQLISYFDPKAEQLPSLNEILEWTKNENILIYKIDNQIAGFIIYQLVGVTLYLRYWFVMPKYRDRKLGSKLFNYFLSRGKESTRQLFWVIQSNENAILRYKHYGFKEEKMYNFVLINNKSKYEG
jgi:ribosomal protein S18 acetylase RimI-like enzyme